MLKMVQIKGLKNVTVVGAYDRSNELGTSIQLNDKTQAVYY